MPTFSIRLTPNKCTGNGDKLAFAKGYLIKRNNSKCCCLPHFVHQWKVDAADLFSYGGNTVQERTCRVIFEVNFHSLCRLHAPPSHTAGHSLRHDEDLILRHAAAQMDTQVQRKGN